jgi:Tfp pilus assembly protein PilF
MENYRGNTQLAIELCKQAIEIDPDFGNPYNDIGSYLISLGRQDEAIPWLEKAKLTKRYEPRHFPHINLGNIYLSKNMQVGALKEFEAALKINPSDDSLVALVARLRGTIN